MVSVPFVVTGLFRVLPGDLLAFVLVTLICLAVAIGLNFVPRRGRRLAMFWLVGCVLYAAFLYWLLWQLSEGLEDF